MTSRGLIDDFLNLKRVALVGVSREPKDFSRSMFREFVRRGYDAVPVNPGATEVDGRPCFPRVQDISPPVDGVLLMTSPQKTDIVVRDCAEAGIRRIWMYRAAGAGAVSENALQFCEEKGIDVVPGYCPYMFWGDSGFGHRLHGFIMKMMGRYPR
jgi:predicted CoA-binding protein